MQRPKSILPVFHKNMFELCTGLDNINIETTFPSLLCSSLWSHDKVLANKVSDEELGVLSELHPYGERAYPPFSFPTSSPPIQEPFWTVEINDKTERAYSWYHGASPPALTSCACTVTRETNHQSCSRCCYFGFPIERPPLHPHQYATSPCPANSSYCSITLTDTWTLQVFV